MPFLAPVLCAYRETEKENNEAKECGKDELKILTNSKAKEKETEINFNEKIKKFHFDLKLYLTSKKNVLKMLRYSKNPQHATAVNDIRLHFKVFYLENQRVKRKLNLEIKQ